MKLNVKFRIFNSITYSSNSFDIARVTPWNNRINTAKLNPNELLPRKLYACLCSAGILAKALHLQFCMCFHLLHFFLQKPVNSELRLAVLNFLRIFSLKLFLIYNQKYCYVSLLNKI